MGETIKRTADEFFPIGLGCMRLPTNNGTIDRKVAKEFICYGIDHGINYVDTAYVYHGGESEKFLGEILKDGYREKIKLSTKLPAYMVKSREDMDKFLNEQLDKLQTDHIDYYYTHSVDLKTLRRLEKLGLFDFVQKAKEEGKINNIGFSYHGSGEEFQEAVDMYDWDSCIMQYNYLDRNIQAGYSGMQYAYSKGMKIIIMEPLKGGILAGEIPQEAQDIFKRVDPDKTAAEWGLSWVLNHKEVSCVLSGMGNLEQIQENIEIAKKVKPDSLTVNDLNAVKEVQIIMQDKLEVNCTGCGYCKPCPQGVNIPECFRIYNDKYLFNRKRGPIYEATGQYYMVIGGIINKPTNAGLCIKCGACKPRCPQSIDIPTKLTEVSKEFEGNGFTYKRGFIKHIGLPLSEKMTKVLKRFY